MKTIIIVMGILCLAITSLYAQKSPATGTITVKVTDAAGKPLPFASVLVKQQKDSALVKGEMTGEDGAANFEKIPAGKYFVQASQIGFSTQHTTGFEISDAKHHIQLPVISLPAISKNLQAVNVTATKPYIERVEGKTVLNVDSRPTNAGNTALDVLRRAPGILVDKDDNILIKGQQSVTVMIDGKLTYLTGEQLANLLKSTPAETIAQIEIMNTPGAKYDAAGNGGMINIKTKKGQMTGMNGSINLTAGLSNYRNYNGGGNFNWRTEKFNVFGTFNHGDDKFGVYRDFKRYVRASDAPTTLLHQNVLSKNNFINNTYKGGIDYYITKNHTVGVIVTGYANAFKSRVFSDTKMSVPGQRLDSVLHSGTETDNHFKNTTINLNYKGILDTSGKEISFDADYGRFNNDRYMLLRDSMLDVPHQSIRNPNAIRNNAATTVTIKSFKADLVWPLFKGKLETGVKASFVTTDNGLRFDSLKGKEFVLAPSRSDQFIYKENIYAAYVNYKKQLNNTSIQGGLRVEKTESDGNSISTGNHVKRSYLDFFPNMSIDHKFNDKNKLGLSYSRRIERPGYNGLNPFLFFLDKYTYGQGNPFLKPEYTHNTELSYVFRDKYIATLGVSYTTDLMGEYLLQNDTTKTSTSTTRNLNTALSYNLSLTMPFDITPWWNSNNDINMVYINWQLKDPSVNLNMANKGLQVFYNTTNTFTLPKDYKLEVSAYYLSPFTDGIFKGQSKFNMDLGIVKTCLKKNGTIKLNVRNILRNEQFQGHTQYNNLDMYIHNIWQFRRVNIGFTYRFGNSSIKGARERQATDEQKRAG